MPPSPDTAPVRSAYLEHAMTPRQRRKYAVAVGLALCAAAYFWVWWLHPAHVIGVGRYAVVTLVLIWLHFLVWYFFFFFMHAQRAASRPEDMPRGRVAMVVTKAPSEPFCVVKRTLEGMLAQDVPHDTWLADEDPSPEVLDWCAAHGVRVSTRKGRPDYHRKTWPRRTRCKEGNLAYFYDHYGYENYDFVSQLDADHVPRPGYLREMLRPFADPAVGYVSAPSICAANAGRSWAARTRMHTEALFHGIFQSGYTSGGASICIGSHYAVRTKALKEAGGLGPELAEDHSTTMMMVAAGWRGVHAMDAIAVGDGPATIADMATQEFQWSRSLVTLLLQHTRAYIWKLPPRLRFQFLFCQLFYPILAAAHVTMFVMPIVALATDTPFANVTWPDFVIHAAPQTLILTWVAIVAGRDGFFRPHDARILSWEKALFLFIQWPWVLAGVLTAVRDALTGTFVDFRITPKAAIERSPLPWRVIVPYALLATIPLMAVVHFDGVRNAAGFYLLALMNSLVYTIILGLIVIMHARENRYHWHEFVTHLSGKAVVAVAVAGFLVFGGKETALHGLHGITSGATVLRVTDVRYRVAGAGNAEGQFDVYLRPVSEWGRVRPQNGELP